MKHPIKREDRKTHFKTPIIFDDSVFLEEPELIFYLNEMIDITPIEDRYNELKNTSKDHAQEVLELIQSLKSAIQLNDHTMAAEYFAKIMIKLYFQQTIYNE